MSRLPLRLLAALPVFALALVAALAALVFGVAAIVGGLAAASSTAVPYVDTTLGTLAGEWAAVLLTLVAATCAAACALCAASLYRRAGRLVIAP